MPAHHNPLDLKEFRPKFHQELKLPKLLNISVPKISNKLVNPIKLWNLKSNSLSNYFPKSKRY